MLGISMSGAGKGPTQTRPVLRRRVAIWVALRPSLEHPPDHREIEIAPAARGDHAGNGLPQPRPCPSIRHEAPADRARGLAPAPVLGIEKPHGAGPLRLCERHLDPRDRCAGAVLRGLLPASIPG